MAEYIGMILTNVGKTLFLRGQTGTPIRIVKVVFGSGVWDWSSQEGATEEEKRFNYAKSLTALVDEEQRFGVSSCVVAGDVAKVTAFVNNNDLAAGYPIREVGILCQDPDDQDQTILYAVTYAGDNYDYMPEDDGINKVEYLDNIYIAVGQAQNITIIVDGTVILATQLDIEAAIAAHNINPEAHNFLFEEFGNMQEILDRIGLPDDYPSDSTTLFAGQQLVYNFTAAIVNLLGKYEHPDYPTVQKYLQKILEICDLNRLINQVFDFAGVGNAISVSMVHESDVLFNRNVRIFEKVQEAGTATQVYDFTDSTLYELEKIEGGSGCSISNDTYVLYTPNLNLTSEHLGMGVYDVTYGALIGAIYEIIDEHHCYINRAVAWSGSVRLLPAEVKNGKYEHVSYDSFTFDQVVSNFSLSDGWGGEISQLDRYTEDETDDDFLIGVYPTGSGIWAASPLLLTANVRAEGFSPVPDGYYRVKVQSQAGAESHNQPNTLTTTALNNLNAWINGIRDLGASHFIVSGTGINGETHAQGAKRYCSMTLSYRNASDQLVQENFMSYAEKSIAALSNYIEGSWEARATFFNIDLHLAVPDYFYSGCDLSVQRTMNFRAIKPKVLLAVRNNKATEGTTKDAVNTGTWNAISSIVLTASDDVRVAFSADNGTTWKKYVVATNEWQVVTSAATGNTKAEVTAMTQTQLSMLLAMGSMLKLKYYLADSDSTFDQVDVNYTLTDQYKLASSGYETYFISSSNTRVKNVSGSAKNLKIVIKDIKRYN